MSRDLKVPTGVDLRHILTPERKMLRKDVRSALQTLMARGAYGADGIYATDATTSTYRRALEESGLVERHPTKTGNFNRPLYRILYPEFVRELLSYEGVIPV